MICVTEQTAIEEALVQQLGLEEPFASLPLGLSCGGDGTIWSSYYIGLAELKNESLAVVPKVDNLDFMALFASALQYQPSADYFAQSYSIDWEKEAIANAQLYDVLTPLLVVQYLAVLDKLVGRGLRRDYIQKEENLHSKIRGKVMVSRQLRQNVINGRNDRFFCRFQEYTADIPVNRLLKKALDAALSLLGDVRAISNDMQSNIFLSSKLRAIEAFRSISSDISPQSVRTTKHDKLNRYYPQAILLAKQILKHYDNSVSSSGCEKKVPPFWIDMSRLFEVYVLGLLESHYPNAIKFQVNGSYGTRCDYLHTEEGIVLDAKYKLWYNSQADRAAHYDSLVADIREISAYARDEKLLQNFTTPQYPVSCVIIHPGNTQSFDFSQPLSTLTKEHEIEGYRDFYHIAVPLPVKK